MNRPLRLRTTLLLVCLATCGVSSLTVAAAERDQISIADFKRVVGAFVAQGNVSTNEVISQRDVLPLFSALERRGMILKRKALLELIPQDQSPLVRLLRSPHGRKFIGQTAGNELMFDRLDRIANEPGGERLLRDLMKLPDAARYAKMDTGPGVPDLIDFLPKSRSSKTRRIKDYKKPTGKLYTLDSVIDYLAKKINEGQP